MRRVRDSLDGYYGLEVDSAGRVGGLTLLWKKDVDCTFKSSSLHHLDCEVRSEGGVWRLTVFYGWPNVADRHLSWELLRLLGSQSTMPWVCIGDFNEVLFSTEMKGGQRQQWQMNNFLNDIDECELRDVPWEGYNFSWDNGQAGEANRQSMLDRAMCSTQWIDMFPYVRLVYLDREWPDHAPIKLYLNRRELRGSSSRIFRFEQAWVGDEGCREAIERGINPTEQYWRQRSRALWLKDGDRNTKFFHTRVGERKRKNTIHKLVDDDGNTHTGEEGISSVAMAYFQSLFASSNPRNFEVLESLGQRVSHDMNSNLAQDYKEEEVIKALNQMHPLKALGPDGMNGLFFQTYWGSVGLVVVSTVLDILRGNRMPKEFNKTNIVLIPKKKAPDKVSDFPPISLCNVIYKLVSKVLANRLKLFLGDIVSENQSAFTPGRFISDNVLIGFELFHFMKK
ncbi:uncharacterized protein LOC141632800 [Silene latifolia]|uniref:uncharacterized protein LOC141632800 n=1 Tax=Silene latifolia TaxID=37657 RepID=UPI003D775695